MADTPHEWRQVSIPVVVAVPTCGAEFLRSIVDRVGAPFAARILGVTPDMLTLALQMAEGHAPDPASRCLCNACVIFRHYFGPHQ